MMWNGATLGTKAQKTLDQHYAVLYIISLLVFRSMIIVFRKVCRWFVMFVKERRQLRHKYKNVGFHGFDETYSGF